MYNNIFKQKNIINFIYIYIYIYNYIYIYIYILPKTKIIKY